jgi:hypothetical protein
MIRIHRIAGVAAALFVLSSAGAVTAQAQMSSANTARVSPRGTNQAQIERALREFGFDARRLRRDQQQAIDDAWRRLLPEADPYRYPLNPAQATAIVYLALVHGREGRGGWGNGGWDRGGDGRDNDGRDGGRGDDGWDRGGSWNGATGECVSLNRRVYDADNAIDGDRSSLFLDDGQKRDVRAAAREAQRIAVDHGWRRVADRAGDVITAASETLPNRDAVRGRVQELKRAVDERCGQDDRR